MPTATAKAKHVHKFRRHKYKTGNIIFFCAEPDCNFKLAPALAIGKRSICWRCGEPFIMNEYSIRLAKPHCDACHQPKKSDLAIEPTVAHEKSTLSVNIPVDPAESLTERLRREIEARKPSEAEDEGEI